MTGPVKLQCNIQQLGDRDNERRTQSWYYATDWNQAHTKADAKLKILSRKDGAE